VSAIVKRIEADYDDDFFAWTQRQAELLQTLRSVFPQLPPELDLENLTEEISSLGSAELHAVESQIQNIFVHLVKTLSDPTAEALPHWRAETVAFHVALNRRYSPSMRQRIRIEMTWRLAKRIAEVQLAVYGRVMLAPSQCPLVLADFTADEFDFDRAVATLSAAMRSTQA
jgi:hypothetical protein